MNRQADIDQVLEAWFLDGPMEMPDRLFDGVLDRVERVPQRRLARLKLRFSDMSSTARWISAAAAAVLVLGVGFAALGRNATTGPGATTAPSPSPSASAAPSTSAIPDGLVGRWMGGPRTVLGIDPIAGTTLLFEDGQLSITQSNDKDMHRMSSAVSALDASRIRTELVKAGSDCAAGSIGDYSWSLSPSGRTLTLTADDEACAKRGDAIAGTWWKTDCPAADDLCLGPLDAGRYSSQYVDPFVIGVDGWKPRFDAVSYVAPDGWSNTADWPGFLDLKRLADTDGTGVYVVADVAAINPVDPCIDEPDPAVGLTAEALTTWLTTLPGVVATEPVEATIGGLTGYRIDLSMDPAWTATCSFSQGEPTRPIFTDAGGGDFEWALAPGTRMRNYLLNSADGRTLLIDIEAQDDGTFDSLAAEATSLVESMTFTR